MKALSLWQPWATLIAIGSKEFETRHWSTTYRGPLLIHAAQRRPTRDDISMMRQEPFVSALRHRGLCYGGALCVVDLVDCIPTERFDVGRSSGVPGRELISWDEWEFGDFSPGRFAWKLTNVRNFQAPNAWLPMRGAQGLFEAPITLEDALRIGGA